MGKEGPCYHCGITSSALWRNGPPAKPILCNACGTRWRTKGTLARYNPIHSKLIEGEEDLPIYHPATTLHVEKHLQNSLKKRRLNDQKNQHPAALEGGKVASGPGALISEEGRDNSGASLANFWNYPIPLKRRSKGISRIEKFRRQLVELHKQEASEFSENVLIENDNASIYSETGLGAALLEPLVSANDGSSPSSCKVDNPCISMESAKPQNSDFKSSQIDNENAIQDLINSNEMREKSSKKHCYTNNPLLGASISIPDEFGNQYVSEIRPPKEGSPVISCTSHFIGCRWMKPDENFDD